LYRRLGVPQSQSGHKRLEEKSFCLCLGLNLDRLVVQPIATSNKVDKLVLPELPVSVLGLLVLNFIPFQELIFLSAHNISIDGR
jgi:hypothetical protein